MSSGAPLESPGLSEVSKRPIEVHYARSPRVLLLGLGLLVLGVVIAVALYLNNPQGAPAL